MFIIAGIGTEVGKTVVSAVLVEALRADYWKPIQTGGEEQTDTQTIIDLVTPLACRTFHTEAYRLKAPLSPHAAAQKQGISIDLSRFALPNTLRPLIVELAGGILVPLTNEYLNLDLIKKWSLPVVIVSKYYLGSINHTLLTIETLKYHKVSILGIIFNGECVESTKDVILAHTQISLLGEIATYSSISPTNIKTEAKKIDISKFGLSSANAPYIF